jgi:hypothetical protein
LSSPARQIVSEPALGKPRDDPKKKKPLEKRRVAKEDGRYLIYYEKS